MDGVQLGFERKLYEMADTLRGNIDRSQYKNVVLGLVFLKYISDAFLERYNEIKTQYPGLEEDRDAYSAANVFFVPKQARWEFIKSHAKQPSIGKIIDDAMVLIEKENVSLKNVLPKNYARPELDKTRLGELIDVFSFKIGDKDAQTKDVLGRVYEYFLKTFGSSNEGEFYTPPSVVKLLVELIEPYSGRVYDPCCGSGGMFVQSAKFLEEHSGKIGDISIYGQEFNAETWRLAKMNLAIRGIDGNLGSRDADTFTNDQHKTLRADYILANPPFNDKKWPKDKLKDDHRWIWGVPSGTANYAWIYHMVTKLSNRGIAAFLLSSISTTEESEIRAKLVDKELVKAIITLPPRLFYSTPIAPVVWVISKNVKYNHGKILFIDLSKDGKRDPENKKNNIISPKIINKTKEQFKKYLIGGGDFDIENFSITKSIFEIQEKDYVLTPQVYINYTRELETTNKSLEELRDEILMLSNETKDNLAILESILEQLDEV